MSKRLDILGARIFGASICHARKYLQPFQKCPNVWTKFPNLAIMHKYKLHIIRIKTCICAFCYFINFLHTFLDIFKTPNKKINLLIPQSRISADKSPSQRDHPSDEYKGYSQMATQSDMDAF